MDRKYISRCSGGRGGRLNNTVAKPFFVFNFPTCRFFFPKVKFVIRYQGFLLCNYPRQCSLRPPPPSRKLACKPAWALSSRPMPIFHSWEGEGERGVGVGGGGGWGGDKCLLVSRPKDHNSFIASCKQYARKKVNRGGAR
jgi:hypothetical protein